MSHSIRNSLRQLKRRLLLFTAKTTILSLKDIGIKWIYIANDFLKNLYINRKLPNNACSGGIEEMFAPKKLRCPSAIAEESQADEKKRTEGLFQRTPEEIKREIESEYNKPSSLETDNQQKSGMSFLNILAFLGVLFALYMSREYIMDKLKSFGFMKNRKNEADLYGYKKQVNNSE